MSVPERMVITIDGPAASGKSSTAQWVAEKLGFLHVDSGSIYRALTAIGVRGAVPPEEWTPAQLLADGDRVSLRPAHSSFDTLIDGSTAEDELRGPDVTAQVSRVARMPEVRAWVNARVRDAAVAHDVVVDGRDMGTAVFPDAPLKIFLIADPFERARRRLTQRHGRRPTEKEVAEEVDLLVHRDAKDATQTMKANDAVLLDTTYLTQPEQVERIVALAHAVSHRPPVT